MLGTTAGKGRFFQIAGHLEKGNGDAASAVATFALHACDLRMREKFRGDGCERCPRLGCAGTITQPHSRH
ncbi:hypothetical protein PRJ39_11075 [Lysobacter enzymogenes]|uniref:hypothetical protein n=1 Tax=Lysobacter enzymogenes TaxID=69 RepID=UPI0037494A0A